MDTEFSKWIITLGVGGVLAGFMFVFYRKDVKQYTELWKTQTEMLLQVVKENTASNVKLTSAVEMLQHKLEEQDHRIVEK